MKFDRHVVFVTPGFAADEHDSVCVPYLQDYFRALQAARPNWRISIVAMQYPFHSRRYQYAGMDVHALGGQNRKLAKPWIWRRTVATIRRLHREQPIDAMHSYWLTEATWVAAKVARRLGIPLLATSMGQDSLPSNRYLGRLPFDQFKLIAVSDFNAAALMDSIKRAPHAVVPFAVAAGDLDRSGNAVRPIDLLAVGSLIPVKRYDRYLRVVKMLSEELPGLRAVLVGDGSDRGRLQRLANEMDLGGTLEFAGTLARAEVLGLMSSAKVFVHTSAVEGTGLVLLEALGRGMHLVTTPVGVGATMKEGLGARKCILSESTFGLAAGARQFLEAPVDWAACDVHPMATMVADHLQMYGFNG